MHARRSIDAPPGVRPELLAGVAEINAGCRDGRANLVFHDFRQEIRIETQPDPERPDRTVEVVRRILERLRASPDRYSIVQINCMFGPCKNGL
jgi:hypothetical protein